MAHLGQGLARENSQGVPWVGVHRCLLGRDAGQGGAAQHPPHCLGWGTGARGRWPSRVPSWVGGREAAACRPRFGLGVACSTASPLLPALKLHPVTLPRCSRQSGVSEGRMWGLSLLLLCPSLCPSPPLEPGLQYLGLGSPSVQNKTRRRPLPPSKHHREGPVRSSTAWGDASQPWLWRSWRGVRSGGAGGPWWGKDQSILVHSLFLCTASHRR